MLLNVLQNSFVGKEAAVGIPLEQLSINNSVDLSMTAMTTRSTVHGVHRTCGHELLPLLLVIGFPPPIISYSLYIYIYRERVYMYSQ